MSDKKTEFPLGGGTRSLTILGFGKTSAEDFLLTPENSPGVAKPIHNSHKLVTRALCG